MLNLNIKARPYQESYLRRKPHTSPAKFFRHGALKRVLPEKPNARLSKPIDTHERSKQIYYDLRSINNVMSLLQRMLSSEEIDGEILPRLQRLELLLRTGSRLDQNTKTIFQELLDRLAQSSEKRSIKHHEEQSFDEPASLKPEEKILIDETLQQIQATSKELVAQEIKRKPVQSYITSHFDALKVRDAAKNLLRRNSNIPQMSRPAYLMTNGLSLLEPW